MTYAEFEGGFFGLCKLPHRRFFKTWIAMTDDLEKLVNFKPDVEVFPVNTYGEYYPLRSVEVVDAQ